MSSSEPDGAAPTVARPLGPGVANRLRLPGPRPTRPHRGPAAIGSVASASQRFATGLARPVPTRHALQGPQVAEVNSFRNANTSPPRWWHPELVASPVEPQYAAPIPQRGLKRAVHRVPTEQNRSPGGILGSLTTKVVPVRRMDAVTAAGPMLTSHDRARLVETVRRRTEATAAPVPPVRVAPSRRQASTRPAPATAPGPAAAASPAPPGTPPGGRPAPSDSVPSGPVSSGAPAAARPSLSATLTAPAVADTPGTRSGPSAAGRPSITRRRPRVSRLATVRGPAGLFATASTDSAPAVGSLATARPSLDLTPPRPAGSDPRGRVSPLRRMVGGGHLVRPATGVAQAAISTSGVPLWLAGPARAEAAEGGRHRAPAGPGRAPIRGTALTAPAAPAPGSAVSTTASASTVSAAVAATPSAPAPPVAPSSGSVAGPPGSVLSGTTDAAPPPSSGTTITPPAARTTSVPGAVVDASRAPGTDEVASGRRAGRRRAAPSGPAGIGLATARRMLTAAHPASAVRPALTATLLPPLGATHAWLPGAAQRAASAPDLPRTSRGTAPRGTGRVGGAPLRARSLGMADLLTTSTPLPSDPTPGSTDSRAGLATAFAAPQTIRPAGGSARSAAPAPPVARTPSANSVGDVSDAAAGTPLGIARRRARSRLDASTAQRAARAATDPATSSPMSSPTSSATPAGAASALRSAPPAGAGVFAPHGPPVPGSARPPSGTGVDALSRSMPAQRARLLRGGTTSTMPSHLPAPPPVSIRVADPARPAVPPIPAAGRVSGANGTLRRSLIDVTAGMFDSPATAGDAGSPSSQSTSGPDAVATGSGSSDGGSAMSEVQRRLQVVHDTPAVQTSSPLDDPATMDALVDEVVDRIEARVIDELERRGRRHNPGVF